jgi:hypothetical protein
MIVILAVCWWSYIIFIFHHKLLISTQTFQTKKEKSIYHTLNMLSVDVTKKCLVGEGWSPVFATSQVINFTRSLMLDYVICACHPDSLVYLCGPHDLQHIFCRFRMRFSVLLLRANPKWAQFFKFLTQKNLLQHISRQTNLLQPSRKLLMPMGMFPGVRSF